MVPTISVEKSFFHAKIKKISLPGKLFLTFRVHCSSMLIWDHDKEKNPLKSGNMHTLIYLKEIACTRPAKLFFCKPLE
jgi:hypothetical protein